MTQENQAPIVASTLRTIDAGGFINTQLDKAATLIDSQHARILELEAELLTEKRHQRTRDAAAVRTLAALGYDWHGGDSWQAAPKAVAETEKEQIQALMDKHQIWIQQTTYEELDRPPYDLFAIQAEQHQFEAFVQDLIALYTIQPERQGLDAEAISKWLLARRSHLGSSRESAANWCEHWGAKSWDNYTLLSKHFAVLGKQGGA